MDRARVEDQLAMAEQRITCSERVIERQREIVAELASGGHDIQEAVRLLSQFESVQKLHIADRDRLRAELANCKWPPKQPSM